MTSSSYQTLISFCCFFSLQPKKLGFSNLTHLRRRKPDESTDYVCPVESSSPQSGPSVANGVQVRPYAGFRGLSPILDRESDRSRDQVGVDDSRADPSPWQPRQDRGDSALPRILFSQAASNATTLLPLLAAHNTSAHLLPALLTPPFLFISLTLCLMSEEIQREAQMTVTV